MAKAKKKVGVQPRSLCVELVLPEGVAKKPIIDSIRQYRTGCRKLYGVLCAAYAAGAQIEVSEDDIKLTPSSESTKSILATMLGAEGACKAHGYALKDYFQQYLYPNAQFFVWNQAQRDISSVWNSCDPEFPTASRGWLALQGTRGIAQFRRRGIGISSNGGPKLHEHTLSLKWDRVIGRVDFKLPRLDSGRYYIWQHLRDGAEGWSLGMVYLSESDGKLRAVITYHRPEDLRPIEVDRQLLVTVGETPDRFLTLAGPGGVVELDEISGCSVVAWLGVMKARQKELEDRVGACGNPRAPWGFNKSRRKNQEVRSRVTKQRANGVKDHNHAWTRRIVTRAVYWRCGTIKVVPAVAETLFSYPWNWTEFFACLKYKAAFHGITVYRDHDPL